MKGRLNLFQRAMLRWRDLYPYNAVHVVRVSRKLDVVRLQHLIKAQLERAQLTGLRLDSAAKHYEWTGGSASVVVAVLSAGSDSAAATCAEIERQLNAPFVPDGAMDPFRFFAIDEGSSFQLGLAYDHFVAGGDSVAQLLAALSDSYSAAQSAPAAEFKVDLYPATYRWLFARHLALLVSALPRLRELIANCRRSARPLYRDVSDGYNAVTMFRVDQGDRAQLMRTAGAWGMTQNDLLLAILLRSIVSCSPDRDHASRRRELAVASIVNVRRDFGPASAASFVPLLASFRVAHPVPDDIDLRQLASFVHAETTRIKSGKLYLLTLLAMALSGFEWRFLTRDKRHGFHAKHYPVWAGVTPLSLNSLWPSAAQRVPPPDYVRAVSTGPLSPIVVAVTSLGDNMQVALSFRTAALSRARMEEIKNELIRNLGVVGRS